MPNENDKLFIANGKFTELKKENQNSVLLSLYWTFETFPFKMHFSINLILKMFPQKISQNIDILAKIHRNAFPWQPAIMGNKASLY